MRIPQPTVAGIWLALPALLTLLLVWTNSEFPWDYWLHVNSGRWMWENHRLITADTFTHTIQGRPVMNQPWLAQLAIYRLHVLGGYPLAQCVAGVFYAAAVALITLLAYRRCGDGRVAAAMAVLGVAVASTNLAVRPQAFSVLFFSAQLCVLSLWGLRRATPAIVAGSELLWSNMHGAFPLGVALPAIFLAGTVARYGRVGKRDAAVNRALIRNYLLSCVLAGAAMFANPQGLTAMRYVSGVSAKAIQRQIDEWLPPTMDNATGALFIASVAGTLLVLCISGRRATLTDALLLAGFFVVGARSQRMVIWWALVVPAILSLHARLAWLQVKAIVGRARGTTDEPPAVVNWIAVGSLALMLIASTPWTRAHNPLLPAEKRRSIPADEPSEALEFLKACGYHGRMYRPMEWGSYVSWRLDPQVKVFIDSRIDFFPDRVWSDYVSIARGSDRALRTLDRYSANLVLWNPKSSPALPAVLEASLHWRNVYADHHSVVYSRQVPAAAGLGRSAAAANVPPAHPHHLKNF